MIPRYARPEMAALFTDEARLARWLEVEVLVAEALASVGVVPEDDAKAIRERAPEVRSRSWATARAASAARCSSAASTSPCSSTASVSPARTVSPSSTSRRSTRPPTCEATSTSSSSIVPLPRTVSGASPQPATARATARIRHAAPRDPAARGREGTPAGSMTMHCTRSFPGPPTPGA